MKFLGVSGVYVLRFIATKLKVNEQQSALAEPRERKFLGFSFTRAETPKRRMVPKAVARFKERVRELTSRTRGVSTERMTEELARYLRGWIGYFGNCETPSMWFSASRSGPDAGCGRRFGSSGGVGQHASLSCRKGEWARLWPLKRQAAPMVRGSWRTGRPCHRAAQCLSRLAGDPSANCAPVTQPTESPYTDPYGDVTGTATAYLCRLAGVLQTSRNWFTLQKQGYACVLIVDCWLGTCGDVRCGVSRDGATCDGRDNEW